MYLATCEILLTQFAHHAGFVVAVIFCAVGLYRTVGHLRWFVVVAQGKAIVEAIAKHDFGGKSGGK